MTLAERVGRVRAAVARHPVAALAALVVAAWAAALGGDFVYDDLHAVAENPALRDLSLLPRYFVDPDLFSATASRMYRPLLLCTYAVEFAAGDGGPLLFKAGNVLLHLTNVLLLYSVACRLVAERRAVWLGCAAFAVHPVLVEAVNMVSARSELLCLTGLLLGMRAHLACLGGSRIAVAGVAGGLVIACGAKETGVVLPALLLGVSLAAGARHGGAGQPWRRLLTGPAVAMALAVGYLCLRRALFGIVTIPQPALTAGHDIHNGAGRDLLTQLCTMMLVLPRTLAEMLVPVGLGLDPYVPYTDAPLTLPVVAGAALLAGLTCWGLAAPRRRPARFAGTLLAAATAAPWVVIPLNVPLAEHRLYGPAAGLALVVVAGLAQSRPWELPRRRRRLLGGAAVAILAVFAFTAAGRSLDHGDEAVLWRQALARNPGSFRAHHGLALIAMERGEPMRARHHLWQALLRYRDHRAARENLAEVELALARAGRGRPAVAYAMARWLRDREPDNPFRRLLMARALSAVAEVAAVAARRHEQAIAEALSVHRIAAEKALVYRTAAHAARRAGDVAGAIALLDQCLARGKDYAEVRAELVRLLVEADLPAAARRERQELLGRFPLAAATRELLGDAALGRQLAAAETAADDRRRARRIEVLRAAGRHAEAAAALDRLLGEAPGATAVIGLLLDPRIRNLAASGTGAPAVAATPQGR